MFLRVKHRLQAGSPIAARTSIDFVGRSRARTPADWDGLRVEPWKSELVGNSLPKVWFCRRTRVREHADRSADAAASTNNAVSQRCTGPWLVRAAE